MEQLLDITTRNVVLKYICLFYFPKLRLNTIQTFYICISKKVFLISFRHKYEIIFIAKKYRITLRIDPVFW